MRYESRSFNDSHEVLVGLLLGVGLAAMAAFWWVWAGLR
jgi:Na+-translocating ferredoxin:NAD+ oxidoreductase RnfD subunit